MEENKGLENIASLLGKKPEKKPPAYPWQDFALKVIEDLSIPNYKRNSVFLICKKLPKHFVEKCYNDTKELCKTGEKWKYFFKLTGKK